MPEAYPAYTAPVARVPRTLFAHAHEDASAQFPPDIDFGDTAKMHNLIPDNWNGLDAIYVWFLGTGTDNTTVNVTINIGTCTEAYNTHTQTVNGIAATQAANIYTCVDLTTTHATVLANLAARDMVQVLVTHAGGDESIIVMGFEMQET